MNLYSLLQDVSSYPMRHKMEETLVLKESDTIVLDIASIIVNIESCTYIILFLYLFHFILFY